MRNKYAVPNLTFVTHLTNIITCCKRDFILTDSVLMINITYLHTAFISGYKVNPKNKRHPFTEKNNHL